MFALLYRFILRQKYVNGCFFYRCLKGDEKKLMEIKNYSVVYLVCARIAKKKRSYLYLRSISWNHALILFHLILISSSDAWIIHIINFLIIIEFCLIILRAVARFWWFSWLGIAICCMSSALTLNHWYVFFPRKID